MVNVPHLASEPAAQAMAPLPVAPEDRGRSAREQIGLAVLAVERARRGALARMRRSRLMLWRYRSPGADELLLAPPDLRAHDASFADEVAAGSFGLAGSVANLRGRSPFAIAPPNRAWARELHGFGWLRHLDGMRAGDDGKIARKLVADWIKRSHGPLDLAWEPEIVGRRILAWLAHAALLLDDAEPKRYAVVMRSLTDQITYLSTSWRDAPDGCPRLVALIGLVHAHLCIAGHDRRLAQSQKLLVTELERQVPSDGGHIGRNPWTLVELLLDLLPLRRCFAARGKTPDPALPATIRRMTQMLRHLRLGDGMPARFNGMGPGERGALATVLAYNDGGLAGPAMPVRSGYARLERGTTIVVADAGPPPPMELAGAACAGCLAFELSSGGELVLVNGGLPGEIEASRSIVARATPSHNTLCLGEQSSASIIRDARLEREIGSPPLRHPDHVTCAVREGEGAIELEASHDGYVGRWGLVHARLLKLDAGGTRLEGSDRLGPAKGLLRFSWDVPFSIHFHLHPDAGALVGPSPEVADLVLQNGEQWRLTATGAALSIEESLYFADPAGARSAQQVVLRARCHGESEVSWTIERTRTADPADANARRQAGLVDRLAETSAGFEDTDANA
jgi:uncharacterized heparinase superfamily protein